MKPLPTEISGLPAAGAQPHWRFHLAPSVIWAAVGAVFLTFQAWVIGRWLADGEVSSISPPRHGISPAQETVFWICQTVVVLAVILCGWWIIRDARRKRQITIHAALFLGYGTAQWMDPIMNYAHWGFANNNATLNVVSWGPYLPGWSGPDRMPQPLTYATGLFFPLLILWIWPSLALATKLTVLRPQWGWPKLAAALLLPVMAIDVIAETLLIRTGSYAYVGASPEFSLFGGHWYQLPFAEVVLLPVAFVVPTVLLIVTARNRGHEIVLFAGTEQMKGASRVWVRLLSGMGFVHTTILLWMVCIAFFLRHAPIPPDTPTFLRL
ncbi:spirocyclase AveC family protein [Streptomyces chattanoogensis]|uniref:spirocyclase AveC family protein n=1 Tax=Streptomyces chattanoogensis TaxID=66876 RepID=UPI0036BB8F39